MNIYVGNLSDETNEDEIRVEFETYGKVTKVKVIKDKTTGKSRGFGFVTMPIDSEAITAIKRLDGYEIADHALKVNKARPRDIWLHLQFPNCPNYQNQGQTHMFAKFLYQDDRERFLPPKQGPQPLKWPCSSLPTPVSLEYS